MAELPKPNMFQGGGIWPQHQLPTHHTGGSSRPLAAFPDLHVLVKFGKGVPADVQGAALLAFERDLRARTGGKLWIEVFKEAKGDDSKLRAMMTPQERMKL